MLVVYADRQPLVNILHMIQRFNQMLKGMQRDILPLQTPIKVFRSYDNFKTGKYIQARPDPLISSLHMLS